MPTDSTELAALLERALADARGLGGGEVAGYIPQLAEVDPELCAVAVCTAGGEVTSAGEDRHRFTLQSLSKPFVYGWALDLLGRERVRQRIGVEPTGDAFDAIIQLDGKNRPHNPMVNAGAIAVTGLLAERGEDVGSLLAMLGRFAGGELAGIDAEVCRSERASGHRNRAIAHLMRHLEMLTVPVDAALDLYFQQCSVRVSCRDLAVMAATLAAGGRNPLTGEQALSPPWVRDVLAVMFTCGFYDAAGRFAFDVGLPAKSGVSGGVLAVAPGRFGIAAFAPRLDALGASVRGTAAVAGVARELRLHLLEPKRVSARRATPRNPETGLGRILSSVHRQLRSTGGGEPAGYLPRARTDLWAIAACTVDGQEAAAGDDDAAFSIQAAANPFAYGLAMEHAGARAVHRKVGVEPSDNPFNAIRFDPRTSKPFNPLGNAGAVAVCSLMPGADAGERLARLLDGFAAFAGAEVMGIDSEVLAAERAAGERNRAIASLLRNFELVDDEDAALELYFQQCSLRVTCRQLARMGATLANAGVEPLSGRRALAARRVRHVLSVMLTCGLHDESGRFAVDVGAPSKSGISGGLVAVVPGRMGIAAFSPRVNDHGTSVRGLAALARLSEGLGLSVFANAGKALADTPPFDG